MKATERITLNLFHLEKDGQHNYGTIETILTSIESEQQLTTQLEHLIGEVRDYNEELYQSYIEQPSDAECSERQIHGLCYRMRMLRKELTK